MAKKKKHHGHTFAPPPDLRARLDRAMLEGRFQAALELAKELHKREPTPAHRELVLTAYLGRARQLRTQNLSRDAVTVLQAALQFAGDDPAWLEKLAEELATSGEVSQALSLVERLPGSPVQARVLAKAVDSALQQEAAGRRLLPATLQADFDRVLQAFAQLEAGQDDAARETLQGIGLRSPFVEWKVLLRGLQAYYQRDDVRALENWQRLNPERLPARLAAPLRFLIDPPYRTAQVPEAQTLLQRQADRLQGQGIVQELRQIQAALARDENLHPAFRLAGGIVPILRQQAPHLLPRLASCFYWAIVMHGEPHDVARYQHTFGTPPDDPHFHRLRALVFEHSHEMEEAHQHWKLFEQSVADHPEAWPGDQAKRVRALVWYHMGKNAAQVIDPDRIPDLPPFLRDHPDRPRPLNPSAEVCFRKSLELAPDQLETYRALFEYHQERDEAAKAEKAAQALLKHFPEHAPTLEALADLFMSQERYDEALEFFQRALRANPLSRTLRGKVSSAHLFRARTRAEAGQFDEARADYQASLSSRDGESYPALCKWAACEFKAGNPERAEELLAQALSQAGTRLAIAFNMVIEAIRLKLPRTLKSRFDKEFKEALAEPPTAAGTAAILSTAAAHQKAGVKYYGQKTHEKKVLGYVGRAHNVDFSEDQLVTVCDSLLALKSVKQLHAFTALGERRFPNNPMFPFLEAESFIHQGPDRSPPYKLLPLLENARRLAEQMPRDPRQQQLLETIREREQMVRALNPFFSMFQGGFDPFGFFGGREDDEDNEDTW